MVKAGLNTQQFSLLTLHGAVLLFALCALFAKWLSLPALYIVIGRSLFAALAIAVFCLLKQHSLHLRRQHLIPLLASGLLLAIHWWSFFYSIQVASVTIGLVTFASFPIFVAFIGPLFGQHKCQAIHIFQAILCVLGIVLIADISQLSSHDISGVITAAETAKGILAGLFSALCFALLTLFNRQYVQGGDAIYLSFWQHSFAGILLLPCVLLYQISPTLEQLALLFILGTIFTALAHTILLLSLRHISAFNASIVVSLEPVYGIFAAFLLINEPITVTILTGASLVILVSIWASRTTSTTTN